MKRNAVFCLCLCLCILFSALLSACATPTPEESSEPVESSETVSVIEDENARVVRAYLDELFAKEWSGGDAAGNAVEWLSPERAEAIRERVKALKAPILTEGDVIRLAEQAATAVAFLRQDELRWLDLPACGLMKGLWWSRDTSGNLYEECYEALLAYTLYLFTPPDYLFREDEVGFTLTAGELWLYLPLAPLTGTSTTRAEALSLLREVKNGVQIPLYGLAEGERPLDFSRCGTPVLMIAQGGSLSLDLYELALRGEGGMELSEEFRALYAEAYVRRWIDRFASLAVDAWGYYGDYPFPDGAWGKVFLLLNPEEVLEVRETVELLSVPILTEDTVSALAYNAFLRGNPGEPVLLPGIDGREDTFLWPAEMDYVTLVHQITAFFIELFTPSAYRFEPLFGFGIGYALRGTEAIYNTPEEAMEVFSAGLVRFAWIDNGRPLFIDRDAATEPPLEDPLYATTY